MKNHIIRASLMIAIGALGWSSQALATAGQVTDVEGRVTVVRDSQRFRVVPNSTLEQGDQVQTAAFSSASWAMSDNSTYTLQPNTTLTITEFSFASESSGGGFGALLFNLAKGGFRSISGLIGSRNRSAYSIRTPSATMGIRGTEYQLIHLDAQSAAESGLNAGTYVIVSDGAVVLANKEGVLTIAAGQAGFAPLNEEFEPILIDIQADMLRKLTDTEAEISIELNPFILGDEPKTPSLPTPGPSSTPPLPTATPQPTQTGQPSQSPAPTPTSSASPTPSSQPTASPGTTATPSPAPTTTPGTTATPSPAPTTTPGTTATPSPAPTTTPGTTATPSPTPTTNPTATPTPQPTAPTPVPTATPASPF